MSYTQKLRKPATFDHLRKKEPLTKTIEIVLADAPLRELKQLQDALSDLGVKSSPADTKKRKELLKAIAEAEAAVDEETVAMKFQAIGRKAYDALLTAYPPTKEQKADAEEKGNELPYNPDTFPQQLVSASCTEPKMTPEEVETLFDEWNNAEIMNLFWSAMEVNTSRRMPNLSNGFGLIPDSETS